MQRLNPYGNGCFLELAPNEFRHSVGCSRICTSTSFSLREQSTICIKKHINAFLYYLQEQEYTGKTVEYYKVIGVRGMKFVVCIAILLLSLIVVATAAHAAPLSRPADPVVLKGADLPMFKGTAPDSLVAFRYEDGWGQIPIQVDERDMRSYGEIYNFFLNGFMGQGIHELVGEFYTDPNTYMGPDTDPMLDDNDEVVFMARDTGNKAVDIADPQGIVPGSRAEVRVSDPLDGATGYIYLFLSAGGLDPSAGQSYVDYQFRLQSGDYRETFAPEGVNLESSSASSEYYERTFTSRWLTEVLRITAPGASGMDILDRRKIRLQPTGATGLCFEPETEAGGEALEGAFVANKSGPVRGIRSHVGFRSGPEIQQDHFFYEQREDIVLHWRVHAVRGFTVFVFVDYDPAAIGMTYFNNNNTGGVIIDGVPDLVIPGVLRWELVSGSPGSLAIIQDLVSNFSLNASSYYLDDDSPVPPQCLGDAFAIGSSGQSIIAFIPDTDLRTSSNTLAWVARAITARRAGALRTQSSFVRSVRILLRQRSRVRKRFWLPTL